MVMFIALALVTTITSTSQGKEIWKPTKSISLNVLYGSSGSIDQIF